MKRTLERITKQSVDDGFLLDMRVNLKIGDIGNVFNLEMYRNNRSTDEIIAQGTHAHKQTT